MQADSNMSANFMIGGSEAVKNDVTYAWSSIWGKCVEVTIWEL